MRPSASNAGRAANYDLSLTNYFVLKLYNSFILMYNQAVRWCLRCEGRYPASLITG